MGATNKMMSVELYATELFLRIKDRFTEEKHQALFKILLEIHAPQNWYGMTEAERQTYHALKAQIDAREGEILIPDLESEIVIDVDEDGCYCDRIETRLTLIPLQNSNPEEVNLARKQRVERAADIIAVRKAARELVKAEGIESIWLQPDLEIPHQQGVEGVCVGAVEDTEVGNPLAPSDTAIRGYGGTPTDSHEI